ncbi:MAG: HYR domain-containing protein [Bacteroidales bacterium]|nr:HYR domain-containing protein [Bacteroidales bacterium]
MKLIFNSIILRIVHCVFLTLLITFSSFSQVSENGKLHDDPVIICPADMVVYTGIDSCSAYVIIPLPEVISNCGEYELTNDYTGTNNASAIYPVGVTQISWTVTDTCGTASCSMTVCVIDNQPPIIICPGYILEFAGPDSCWAFVVVPQPEVFDNCAVDSIWNDYTLTGDASDSYSVGVTEIWWYAIGIYGNKDSCMTAVVVIDTIPPMIICPEDIVGLAGSDSCWAFVVVLQPEVFDNCAVDSIWNDYTLTGDASGSYYVGLTEVWWYGLDIFGNTDSCMAIICVEDTVPPEITCPGDIVQLADPDSSSAFVVVPEPGVFDNCWADSIWNNYTGTGNASEYYPIGETLITWYALDVFGNLNSCDMTIQVTDNYAIDEKEIVSFVIYPNPTDGTFTISYTIPENEAVDLKIIDLTGQVVYLNKNLNALFGQENQIDITGLRKGIYIVRLETVSGVVTKKVTVI